MNISKRPLFIDIETCRKVNLFKDLNDNERYLFVRRHCSKIERLWKKISYDSYKSSRILIESQDPEIENELQDLYESYASFEAEYAKVVSIAMGAIRQDELVAITCNNDDFNELNLLNDFVNKINSFNSYIICGWNIINFDLSFLFRRIIINGIKVPEVISMYGKKPWEVQDRILDLQQVWANGAYGTTISLDSACRALGIESSKEGEIIGATISNYVHLHEDPISTKTYKINEYCLRDIHSTAKVYKILTQFI